jgi:hypothetical protein
VELCHTSKGFELQWYSFGLCLPANGEFDIEVHLTLTKKQTNEVKAHPEIYRFVPSTSTFEFLDLQENLFYPISFRVVRFVLPSGDYETFITFPPVISHPMNSGPLSHAMGH